LTSETTHATPRCQHFGACGGCQHQDLAYEEQLTLKRTRLRELLEQSRVELPGEIVVHSSRSYSYRNRIRLRLESIDAAKRFGYNRPATTEFLPISECPISAPVLIQTAEALLATAAADRDTLHWVNAAAEVELFTNDDLSRVQLTLFCAPRTKAPQGSFERFLKALQRTAPQVVGAAAAAFDERTGPTGRILAEAGAPGLNYRVGDETYWITRGGFFQVNRFLLPTLVELVCIDKERPRSGTLVWDIFSGVGLFSRILARSFTQVTAVEANPIAIADLRAAFGKLGHQFQAVESTAVDFLRAATLQRDRPDLVVLDPPRAGAGVEACGLLARIAPRQIVYISCDPTTLVRDLAVLQPQYEITAMHLIDLFPQTSHIEAIAVLSRRA
jgi:23S rRNA (uracil1939-C5)-methyltransferase